MGGAGEGERCEVELVGGRESCNSFSRPSSAFGSTHPVDQLEIVR